MSPEVFTAIATLSGVGLGIAGALGAARIQARGSHAQADATFRAAETTATTQYAALLQQQNREAQRAAYRAFLSEARQFIRDWERARVGRHAWPEGTYLKDSLHRLMTALSTVELEGPSPILANANEIAEAAKKLTAKFDLRENIVWAWRRVREEGMRVEGMSERAARAVAALEALRVVSQETLPVQRRMMAGSRDLENAWRRLGDLADPWREAYAQASRMLEPFRTLGIIEPNEMQQLLRDAAVHPQPADLACHQLAGELNRAVLHFVGAAREHLGRVHPETPHSSAGDAA
ncbi:hypothetical protein [Streptomyces subrutilus]|uniref:hypothetical protein n=1 Tax=Streptomyces subrutilus TaxID=36818 RepID=UPI0033E69231